MANIKKISSVYKVGLEVYVSSLFDDANLQAYYRLEGNADDSKGSNHGTGTDITYSVLNGKFGLGGGLNGTSSKIVLVDFAEWTSGSISLWIKPTNNIGAPYGHIPLVSNHVGLTGPTLYLYIGDDAFGEAGDGLAFGYHDGSWKYIVVAQSWTAGQWYHVVANWGSGGLKLYVNNVLVASDATKTGAPSNNVSSWALGWAAWGTPAFFNGAFDDVALFNRALTPTEVSNLYISSIKKVSGVYNIAQEVYVSPLFSDNNLLACYRHETGALTVDSKGANTLTNNNNVGEGVGKFGVCADFSSANTNKSLSRNAYITNATSNFTLCGWVYCYNINQFASFFTNGFGDAGGWGLFISKTGAPGSTGSRLFALDCWIAWHETSFDFAIAAWTHIALVNNGAVTKVYANGAEVYSGTPASFGTPSAGFVIGANMASGGAIQNFFSGMVDDVAVFDRALTPTEILNLYTTNIKKIAGVA